MLYLFAARLMDAEPYLAHYKLKKDLSSRLFPVYTSESALLCVTGEGQTNAAAATGYVAGRYPWIRTDDSWMLQVGLCYAEHGELEEHRLGGIILPHTLVSGCKKYYPDLLYRHDFTEAVLVDTPEKCAVYAPAFYDGEAAGFYQVAVRCLPIHRVIVLKTVAKRGGEAAVKLSVESVIPWLERVRESLTIEISTRFPLSEDERALVQLTAENLRLTHSQRIALEKDCLVYKSGGGTLVPVLRAYTENPIKTETKQEGKKAYARLRQALLE